MTAAGLCALAVFGVTPCTSVQGTIQDAATKLKLALDPEARTIDYHPKKTTLSEMLSIPRPPGMRQDGQRGGQYAKRVAPFETTIWELKVHVLRIEVRADGDYYLVIVDDKGNGTVAELPKPEACKGSRFQNKVMETRKSLDAHLSPSGQPKLVGKWAIIRGIGHFGQSKLSDKNDNGARIQPLLGLTWVKDK